MNFQSVEEIYEANDSVRARLVDVVGQLDDERANLPTENGKWTVEGIVEHLCKVEAGMTAIAAKLLAKAESEEKPSDGKVSLSESFVQGLSNLGTQKLEAPDVVVPDADQTIAESLLAMGASRDALNALRTKFESFDGTEFTFPHPYFGQMSAQDWLALVGLHEARHLNQIEKILSNNR